MPITIRKVDVAETAALAQFGETCFRETFAYLFPEEAMDEVCQRAFAPAMIGPLIEHGAWVAQAEEGWRGYLALSPAPCPVAGLPEPHLELSRLYVTTPWHGTGVSDALMEAFLTEATARGTRAVWLEAFQGNPRALAFYTRWGFQDLGGRDSVREGLRLPHRILGTDLSRAVPGKKT
jgi:GNAT superfamily N-acetyltransferase